MRDAEKTKEQLIQELADLRRRVANRAADEVAQNDAALYTNDGFLRAVFKTQPDIAFIIDEYGLYLDVLTDQDHLLFAEAEQLKGRTLHELYPPQLADQFLDFVRRTIDTQAIQTMEYALDVPAGHRWFEGRAAAMSSSDNEVQTVVFVARDITERKLMETSLQRYTLEQNLLLKISHSVSSTLNLENVLQIISDGTAELLAIETAAIYLLENEQLYLGATTPPLDPQMPESLRWAPLSHHPHIQQALSTHQPIVLPDTQQAVLSPEEAEIVELRQLRSLLYLPFHQEETPIGVLILGTIQQVREFTEHEIDLCRTISNQLSLGIQNARLYTRSVQYAQELEAQVAERKRAARLLQARLRLSEYARSRSVDELMQLALDEAEWLTGSQIGFFLLVDADQQILRLQVWSTNTLNNNMCSAERRGHQYPVDEAGVWADCVRERCPIVHNNYASLPHRSELPEGHVPVIRELVVPIMRDDRIVAILGVGNKVDDYCDADVNSVSQLADSAWDIIERRRTEVDLDRSQQLIALKDRFISMVSHEFRIPLAVIKINSDILARYAHKLDEETRAERLDGIQAQISHLTELIDDTLAINQSQRGKIEFNPSAIDLAAFCRSLFDMVQFSDTEEHQYEFINQAPAKPVMVDEQLLKHILSNLLSNAAKYSPARSRILFRLDYDDNHIFMTVSDEGIGIPVEDQDQLFEPFHRASNVGSTTGTGLGLSIVKEYVELHGGTIEVESAPGQGSTFVVSLPLHMKG